MNRRNLPIFSAVALALSIGITNNANADVHAVAVNDISNLQVIFSTPTLPTSATFRVDGNANLGSVAGADTTNQVFNAGVAPFNIVQAFQGAVAAPAENTFSPVGDLGGNYARADSVILTSELSPGLPPTPTGNRTRAQNVAESWLKTNDTGFGDAGNSSVTTVNFQATAGQTVTFSFDADPYLQAQVDAGSAFASDASAEISVNFVITNSAGQQVFVWSPSGAGAGAITGGNATLDPFSLNETVTRDQSNTGLSTSDNALGSFSATSNALAADIYTIELRMRETVNTQLTTAAVPEPETLSLLGLSMLCLGIVRKRRKFSVAS